MAQAVQAGDSVRVTGQIYKREIKSDYQALYLRNTSVEIREQTLKESKFIIYDKSMEKVETGKLISAKGKISFYESARNPGNFDQKLYYERQGIHACLWTEKTVTAGGSTWKLMESLADFRRHWKEMLFKVLGERQGAVLCGIMLGDKTDIEPEVKELYQVNGVGHILAISGLHLSFIGIGMYTILRRITGSCTAGGIAGICFLVLYILMAGVTVSAVRAAVMFMFRVGADMSGRHYDAPTALAFAALTVLLWRPLYIGDGGFWLSFGAVAGVIAILPLFRGRFRGRVYEGICAGISIQLAIFPVLLYYFFEFPLYALLLNIVIIPLMTVLLSLGITGSAAAVVLHCPGTAILSGCKIILQFYEWVCRLAAEFPAARVITGRPPVASIVFYYLVLCGIVHIWSRKKSKKQGTGNGKRIARNVILSVFIGTTAFLALLLPNQLQNRGGLTVTMLDVGQGDGIFLKSPEGVTYFVDGGSSDIKQAGKYRIEPFLKVQGVGVLDYIFISHGDSDHLSAVREMIARGSMGIRIKHIVLPIQKTWDDNLRTLAKEAEESGVKVLVMEQGQKIQDNKLAIRCLYPGRSYEGESGNPASMVLAVSFGQFDMLFTGDVEGEGEKELEEILNKEGKASRFDILKVAHHGSKNSTSDTFLNAAEPSYAFISAGQNSRYGHPHKETIERLKEKNCRIYSTAESGAVTVNTNGSSMHISTFLSGKQLN